MKDTLNEQIKKLYFIGFLILIFISTVSFALISSITYKNQTKKFSQEILNLNINILDNKLIEVRENQKAIVNDNNIREILNYRKKNKFLDYSIELYNYRNIMDRFNLLFSNLKVDNIYIVNRNGEVYYSLKNSFRNNKIQNYSWFTEITVRATLGTSYISKAHNNNYLITPDEKQYISIVMPFSKLNSPPEEYLICDIALDKILFENNYSGITFAFLDSDNKCYLINNSSISTFDTTNLKKLSKIEKYISKNFYNNEEILITSIKSKIFGLEILGIKKLTEITEINKTIFETFILIIFIAVFLSTFISYKISDIITAPVKRLIKNCKIVSTGNYNIVFQEEKNYEVNLLSQVIKSMIDNITFLNNKIIEEEKKIVEEKMRTLQHQINPHFINNILQSIKSLAITGENKKISHITTLLGKIMAYSVYQPYNYVTLKEEIEHIKNYLDIQNIRFDNKILYFIDIEEDLMSTKISKLTLQPLLENSIEHGIKSLEKGIITISAEEEKNSISVILNDNGLGMSEKKLFNLQENLKEGKVYFKEKSIGILNVNERLKRKYGNEFGVEINSKEKVGTTVIVKLPKVKLEKECKSL